MIEGRSSVMAAAAAAVVVESSTSSSSTGSSDVRGLLELEQMTRNGGFEYVECEGDVHWVKHCMR